MAVIKKSLVAAPASTKSSPAKAPIASPSGAVIAGSNVELAKRIQLGKRTTLAKNVTLAKKATLAKNVTLAKRTTLAKNVTLAKRTTI